MISFNSITLCGFISFMFECLSNYCVDMEHMPHLHSSSGNTSAFCHWPDHLAYEIRWEHRLFGRHIKYCFDLYNLRPPLFGRRPTTILLGRALFICTGAFYITFGALSTWINIILMIMDIFFILWLFTLYIYDILLFMWIYEIYLYLYVIL